MPVSTKSFRKGRTHLTKLRQNSRTWDQFAAFLRRKKLEAVKRYEHMERKRRGTYD